MRSSPVTKMSNYLSDQSLAATYSKGGGGGGHHDDGYDSSGYGGYGGYGHGGGGGGCVVSGKVSLYLPRKKSGLIQKGGGEFRRVQTFF